MVLLPNPKFWKSLVQKWRFLVYPNFPFQKSTLSTRVSHFFSPNTRSFLIIGPSESYISSVVFDVSHFIPYAYIFVKKGVVCFSKKNLLWLDLSFLRRFSLSSSLRPEPILRGPYTHSPFIFGDCSNPLIFRFLGHRIKGLISVSSDVLKISSVCSSDPISPCGSLSQFTRLLWSVRSRPHSLIKYVDLYPPCSPDPS